MDNFSKRTILGHIMWFVNVFAGILLVLTVAAIFMQVCARYFFNYSFSWSEELPMILFAWITFLGAGVGVYRNEHMGIDLLVSILPKPIRKIIELIGWLLMIGFCACIIWVGTQFSYMLRNVNFISIAFPKGGFYISLVVGCALMLVSLVAKITQALIGKDDKNEGNEMSERADKNLVNVKEG